MRSVLSQTPSPQRPLPLNEDVGFVPVEVDEDDGFDDVVDVLDSTGLSDERDPSPSYLRIVGLL